ncbi:MAG: hypothetical protein PHP32_01730 [Candidatus Izemoplasmatales bacterium]|nr:hypothetical protein [Candidatus Izemoplasmatales bacterium]
MKKLMFVLFATGFLFLLVGCDAKTTTTTTSSLNTFTTTLRSVSTTTTTTTTTEEANLEAKSGDDLIQELVDSIKGLFDE